MAVSETSRLNGAADALAQALEALAGALVHARPDAMAESAALIETRAQAFRDAAASAPGQSAAEPSLVAVATALARCRRLGASLSRITGQQPSVDLPSGYTPVGHPRSQADGASFVTARG